MDERQATELMQAVSVLREAARAHGSRSTDRRWHPEEVLAAAKREREAAIRVEELIDRLQHDARQAP